MEWCLIRYQSYTGMCINSFMEFQLNIGDI